MPRGDTHTFAVVTPDGTLSLVDCQEGEHDIIGTVEDWACAGYSVERIAIRRAPGQSPGTGPLWPRWQP